jgi:peptidoglycan/LPS O-acetylase OafA/YrhL
MYYPKGSPASDFIRKRLPALFEFVNASTTPPVKIAMWFPGLDWLRVIFIALVVSIHLNIAQEFAQASGNANSLTGYDILFSQVFCIAVPGFLLIAVFLQAIKNSDWGIVRARLVDTVFLYAFWVGSWIVWTHGRPEHGVIGLIMFFLKGGGWAFYFFMVLLIANIVFAIFHKFPNKVLWLGLFLTSSLVMGAFLTMALKSHAWTRIETYWWPISFLPIPFMAILLARHWPALNVTPGLYRGILCAALVLSVAAGIFEWCFAANATIAAKEPLRPFLPPYLRISPMLIAFTAVLAVLKIRFAPQWIRFIARNSLGIFCLHVFILRGLHQMIASVAGPSEWSLFLTLVVVLVGGAFATEFVRKLFRERLV